MHQHRFILSMALSLLVYTAVAIGAQPRYTVTDLGAFQPNGIAGPWVVGEEGGFPVRLNLDTGEKIVLDHDGHGGSALDVLPTGEATGYAFWVGTGGALNQSAAFWNVAGRATLLAGSVPTVAYGLNRALTFAGAGPQGAMRWWADGRAEVLVNDRPQFGPAMANGVDQFNRVWGFTGMLHASRARVWDVDGQAYDLHPPGSFESYITAVNADGVATGSHELEGEGSPFAFATRVTLEGGTVALPNLPNLGACRGMAITRAGVIGGVCGFARDECSRDRAALWPSESEVIDLNTQVNLPDWRLAQVRGINDDGVLIVNAVPAGRITCQSHPFLLTPLQAAPMVALTVNQATFQPGQTLRVTLDLSNPGPILTTDVYVGVILPDGVNTLFLTNFSPLEGVMTTLNSDARTFARLLRNVSWPAGMRTTQQDYFTHTFTGLEPSGTYHFLVGWTKPNSLEDGRIDEGDVLALAWAPFTFTRGSTQALYATMRAIQAKHGK